MSVPYYVEFGGGLGDVFYQMYTWGQYRALEKLREGAHVQVVLVSHNPYVAELFRWHPKREQMTVRSVGYWSPEENDAKRREHKMPPHDEGKRFAMPSYRDDTPMPFYLSNEDNTVLAGIQRAGKRFRGQAPADAGGFVVFSVSAGLPERDIPPEIVCEIAEAVIQSGRLPVFVGRTYERHGRRERRLPDNRCYNAIDRLTVPGVARLIQEADAVVCCHSAVHLLARMERRPQLLLYPESVRRRHFDNPDQWAASEDECIHGTFDQFCHSPTEVGKERDRSGVGMLSRFLAELSRSDSQERV